MISKYFNRNGEIAFRMWLFASSLAILERMPNLGKVTNLLAKVNDFGGSDLFRTQATAEEKADLAEIRRSLLAIHEPQKEDGAIYSVRSALKELHNPAVEKFPTASALKSAHFATDLGMDQQDFEQFLYQFMWQVGAEFPYKGLCVDSTVGEFLNYYADNE